MRDSLCRKLRFKIILCLLSIILLLPGSVISGCSLSGIDNPTNGGTLQSLDLKAVRSGLRGVTVGHNITVQLGAMGGKPPYSWKLISGELPAGLSLNENNGQITGTPSQSSDSGVPVAFAVMLTDSAGTTAAYGRIGWELYADNLGQASLNARHNQWAVQQSTLSVKAQQLYTGWSRAMTAYGDGLPFVDYVDLISINSKIPDSYPLLNLSPDQSLYLMPTVQGDPVQPPWIFTASGLPKGITCDSKTGVIQGNLKSAKVGATFIEVYFDDSAGNGGVFTFPIIVSSSQS